jgi:hypothetical protein
MALFNFECHQNTDLKRRAAKSAAFCCYKKCTLAVINERDYITLHYVTFKPTAIIVFRKQRQKLKLVSFKALYNAKGKKVGVGWGWGKSCNIRNDGGQVGRRGTYGRRDGGG